jgi:prophage regulatory protein
MRNKNSSLSHLKPARKGMKCWYSHFKSTHMKLLILKRRAVEISTGLSRSSIYRLAANGQFPKPIPLGARAVGWRADEIAAWIEQRTAARDAQGTRP